ncbi:glycosyltransferase involved in cell wall biosynthesis [Pedobacter africanus]|uniref:Glycosyltransferase involved in cell wall biosynthesis n=1 Tax=Pedobacter africanus TaxID=151894 RepID=A0ACC6L2R5_9SPHI|nr:glycosyltransferase family 4 protein [Pedobacter africanus]MDR6785781.1 glycosyltransferase involved in cell wall biosynthesis [Pedobacter africanus]
MKVVHLNTYEGNGGAGRACLRLSDALNAAGTSSQVLVYFQFKPSNKTGTFSKNPFQKAWAIFHILAERYLSKAFSKALKTPFSLQWFGRSVVHHPEVKSADIIHLHWINHGFLSPKFLAELDELEKPVVWTFHDSNAFTGGCHVRYSCENYHKECGSCPLLRFSGKNDLSHKTWLRKKKAYSELNCHIVAPSNWMAKSVKISSLMGFREVTVIPNTIETNVFKPYVKAEAKKILKIHPDKFVMMSGFMASKNDKHKGTSYLIDALNDLATRPGIVKENIELVIFGNKDHAEVPEFPFKTTFLGNINNDEHLAKCYSAADVFIAPSLEDNLPNTVMESLACATPVVAFKTGGIPDMVKHLENGYLAEYQSAADLATGIEWLYHDENAPDIQKEARRTILTQFSEAVIAEKHQLLYHSLLDLQPK